MIIHAIIQTTRDRMLHLQTLMAQQLAEEVVAARGFGRALVNCVCREQGAESMAIG